jgi:uncharacterized circularly permuted ATP-grasp superfamily protein/uncharacterized alpha-E superfamily protein
LLSSVRAANPVPVTPPDETARDWIAAYRAGAGCEDVVRADPAWSAALVELAGQGDLATLSEQAERHAAEAGLGRRVTGEVAPRSWSLSPIPLLIDAAEWRGIEAGIAQRTALLELVLADLYGSATLVDRGLLPAAVVAGSPGFLRPLVGLPPPNGRYLHLVAFDLQRDAGGGWRVTRDDLNAPAGLGYALENRLAMGRVAGGLHARLNVERHAPFFAAFREGLARSCRRADPRIGLLTPGRHDPDHAEQAHLARYLGFLLVEPADLTALDERLYVRTIGGLKRLDALWRRGDARLLDPLAFDSRSTCGVAGSIDAYLAGELVLANAPGAGALEAAAMAAYLPEVAAALLGEELLLPGIPTWWCGDPGTAAVLAARSADLQVAPAFGAAPMPPDLDARPQDHVVRAIAAPSTMPVAAMGGLVARPFALRVFAARDAEGGWRVLPGGWARIGERGGESWSADVCVHGPEPVAPATLLPAAQGVRVRRNPGTLPSRAADDLFWLGRYLERGEALLAAIRVLGGATVDEGSGARAGTTAKLVALIAEAGAAPWPPGHARTELHAFAEAAMGDPDRQSVAAINARARRIGDGARDRLSADTMRLLEAPFPHRPGLLDRAGSLQRRYAALAGLAAEHMSRTDAWAFHDLGRRVERALSAARLAARFGMAGADAEDLQTLLDLSDSQISYRQRYQTGIARVAVVDLVALDAGNPRGLAFQLARIGEHLLRLPVLADDGMAEPQQVAAGALVALMAGARAETLDAAALGEAMARLHDLSDLVARRYFLQGAEPMRAGRVLFA